MGCGQSAPVQDTAAKQRHDEIEKQLKKAEKEVCKLAIPLLTPCQLEQGQIVPF
jgi:hypothetical protein